MEAGKINIRLCMGSSCYSRGNDEVLEEIRSFISKHDLGNSVDFRGHLCNGNCNKGPNLKIDNESYQEVNLSSLKQILSDLQLVKES